MTTDIRKPGLMGDYTDEELNEKVIAHAKYFTVVDVRLGGYVRGETNYIRTEYPTLEEARVAGEALYKNEGRRILIYAVADFSGANNFSRPVDSFPRSTWMSRAEKEKIEKKKKAEERAAATAARKAARIKAR